MLLSAPKTQTDLYPMTKKLNMVCCIPARVTVYGLKKPPKSTGENTLTLTLTLTLSITNHREESKRRVKRAFPSSTISRTKMRRLSKKSLPQSVSITRKLTKTQAMARVRKKLVTYVLHTHHTHR